jgi:prepilin-type N-terminal cleavage/methylation domain-containing protein
MSFPTNHRLLRDRHVHEQGFSLVELLIVVIIILVIAAIAIPNLLRSRMLANESSAVSSIRQINTAEGTYSSSWGSGYAPALANLGGPAPCMVATPLAACLIDPLLSTGGFVKSGYVYNAAGTLPDANGFLNGFEVNATPVQVQVSGQRAFCADASGVIKFVTPGAAAIGVGAGACAAIATVPGTSGPVGN